MDRSARLESLLILAVDSNCFDYPFEGRESAWPLVQRMARFAGLSSNAFSHWRRMTSPRLAELAKILEAFNRPYAQELQRKALE